VPLSPRSLLLPTLHTYLPSGGVQRGWMLQHVYCAASAYLYLRLSCAICWIQPVGCGSAFPLPYTIRTFGAGIARHPYLSRLVNTAVAQTLSSEAVFCAVTAPAGKTLTMPAIPITYRLLRACASRAETRLKAAGMPSPFMRMCHHAVPLKFPPFLVQHRGWAMRSRGQRRGGKAMGKNSAGTGGHGRFSRAAFFCGSSWRLPPRFARLCVLMGWRAQARTHTTCARMRRAAAQLRGSAARTRNEKEEGGRARGTKTRKGKQWRRKLACATVKAAGCCTP